MTYVEHKHKEDCKTTVYVTNSTKMDSPKPISGGQ